MLQVENLQVGYGRLLAVKGVSLKVAKGEIVFVVGPNGAGKSTLLKAITGLMAPKGGSIRFDDSPTIGLPVEQLCLRGLVLVPEGRHIFGSLTVQENLLLGAMSRKDRDEVAADMARVIEAFPILGQRFKGTAGYLSGGEQQQLAIARAILQKPKLIMIDEPSLGLAPLVIDQVYESLRKLQQAGVTLLVVEQSTARVLDLASRVYVFRNGSIVLEGNASQLIHGSALEDAYFGYTEHDTLTGHK